MAQIGLIFFVLTGAAALGFLFARAISMRKEAALRSESKTLAESLKECQAAVGRASAENEAQKLSMANLQKLLQNIEIQTLELEQSLEYARRENARLEVENKLLAEREETVREIEVIREVPVLVFRETRTDETKREKAAKLVRAFKKGYLEDKKKAAPPPQ